VGRNQLYSQLQHVLQLAAYSEHHGISIGETRERHAEARAASKKRSGGITRRQFLQSAAVVSAGLSLPLPSSLLSLRNQATAPRVVIVGAGTAGLTAAYRLQGGGIASRVIEASDRVGGRMYTLRDAFPGGQLVELGGELIDSDHESLMGLVDELGLTLTDLQVADGDLETETFFFNGQKIPIEQVMEEFRPVAAAINSDLELITGDGDVTYSAPNNGQELDVSIAEWFDRHQITGLIRDILDVAYTGEYGLEIDDQSAFNLLWLIGTDESEFKIYGDSDERYHIAEGNDAVPTGLAERLETPVELETWLEAIRQNSSGSYVLTVNQNGTVSDIEADIAVLAIPFTILRQVYIDIELPPVKRKAIDELGYGTNAKLMVGFDERVWQVHNSNGSTFSDLPYQATWDTSRGQEGTQGVLTNFLGGLRGIEVGTGSDAEQAEQFVAQIEQVFPGAAAAYNGTAVRQHWPTIPYVLGSYSCYKPGQTVGIRGAELEAVGNLYFAGEHTSLDYQGYMNGASESGERVAAEILEALGN
jgi:monoamine oxidase